MIATREKESKTVKRGHDTVYSGLTLSVNANINCKVCFT